MPRDPVTRIMNYRHTKLHVSNKLINMIIQASDCTLGRQKINDTYPVILRWFQGKGKGKGKGKGTGKGKATPVHAWTGPEGSRRLRLPKV